MVLIPEDTSKTWDIIQHHHGTIIPDYEDDIPSEYKGGINENSEIYFIGPSLASNGYIVSMPDYTGYGISSDREHPYTFHSELANVSTDMLFATKQLVEALEINSTNNVFLTGWSEGGGAGLATHRNIQDKFSTDFTVKASSLLAGPYDYYSFVKLIFDNASIEDDELSIYNWSFYTLNNYVTSLNKNTADIWLYSIGSQNDALDIPSLKPIDIFQPDFMQSVLDESNATWISAFKENTLINDWVPTGQLFFHSGTNDQIVPHLNTINAHQYFRSVNANSTLYEYPEGDHYTPLYEYIITTINDFNKL